MKTLLFVEDNENLGATLASRFSDEGFEVIWAKSINDARNQAGRPITAAIVDLALPDGDGLSFAGQFLKPRGIPFIFLTAQNSAENRLEGYELGAADFVPKPFHFKELMLRLSRVIEATPRRRLSARGFHLNLDGSLIELDAGQSISLQPRELAVLKMLIEKSPDIVGRESLLLGLKADDASLRSVDNSILKIRQLLGADLSAPLRTVRGIGYQWLE